MGMPLSLFYFSFIIPNFLVVLISLSFSPLSAATLFRSSFPSQLAQKPKKTPTRNRTRTRSQTRRRERCASVATLQRQGQEVGGGSRAEEGIQWLGGFQQRRRRRNGKGGEAQVPHRHSQDSGPQAPQAAKSGDFKIWEAVRQPEKVLRERALRQELRERGQGMGSSVQFV